jgi:nucleotide-binding universal stress UspA family protein
MFDHILYPTDFSDVSMKALNYIKQLKNVGAKDVTVLHVIDERSVTLQDDFSSADSMMVENQLKKYADEKCKKIVEQLQENGQNASFKITKGIPFLDILKTAEEEGIALIVIGSHGKSNIKEMLLGSVSENVIRKSVLPLLVVKR